MAITSHGLLDEACPAAMADHTLPQARRPMRLDLAEALGVNPELHLSNEMAGTGSPARRRARCCAGLTPRPLPLVRQPH